MKTKDLAETLEKLQAQLAALSERIERLEAAVSKAPAAKVKTALPEAKAAAPPEPAKPEITEEELLAISAALGAYLGVRVHIKQIRLLSSTAWAQEGRVSIQASHRLHN
jgi:methylmalonyl-CoA carboxyltransferase 12S subunit